MKHSLHFGIRSGLLAIIAVALVPLAVLGSIQIYLHAQDLFDDQLQQAKRISDLIAKDTDQGMQNRFTQAERLAKRPEAQAESIECNALMTEFRRSNLDFLGTGVIDKSGTHRCTSQTNGNSFQEANFSDIHWFIRAQTAEEPFSSQPYFGRRRQAWIILVAAPIRGADGDFRGTINLPMNPESLRPTIQEVLHTHASVLIVDDAGRVIAGSSNLPAYPLGSNASELVSVQRVLHGDLEAIQADDPTGRPSLFASAIVPSTGWHVVTYLPSDIVWATIRAEVYRLGAAWLAIVLMSLVLAHFFAGFITRPLQALANLAQRRQQQQHTDERVTPAGPRELVTLSKCINKMLDQQERSMAELRIAASAFEVQEAILVTDAEHRIIRVNEAFKDITGYSEAEAVGNTPGILRSEYHDDAFFEDFHRQLTQQGSWRGEIWNRRKNGEIYPSWISVSVVKDDQGRVINYVGAFTDIGAQKEAEQTIEQLANYDPLTELPNRQLGLDRLSYSIGARARHPGQGALMLLDLDNFKYLNEATGHAAGDEVLKQITARIRAQIRQIDTLARVGGDEFLLIFENLGTENPAMAAYHAEQIARKVLDTLTTTFDLENDSNHGKQGSDTAHVTGSIGIALIDSSELSVMELFTQAEAAMYQAKQEKGNSLRFFDESMQRAINQRAMLERSLRQAHERRELVLHFQPQVDHTGRIAGVEGLLRWQHPEQGLIPPGDFIPLAEETGLIVPIGTRVLEEACELLVAWQSRPEFRHMTLAVNVSPLQFTQPDFGDELLALLAARQVPPDRLELEITENMLLTEDGQVRIDIHRLRAAGVRLAIDDFGVGYSSLSYLKRLPFTKLKIDRSFVADIDDATNGAVIVRTIAALANTLELELVAEGVESEAQMALLRQVGCDAFQGYLFSRPVPLEELEAMVLDPATFARSLSARARIEDPA